MDTAVDSIKCAALLALSALRAQDSPALFGRCGHLTGTGYGPSDRIKLSDQTLPRQSKTQKPRTGDSTADAEIIIKKYPQRHLLHTNYKTEKYVLTRNKKVGVLHRLLHLGILCYVIGWVFIVKKGYQESDSAPQFSIITKLKGSSFTKGLQEFQERLWDVADFVKPAQGENVLFLVTNFISTPGQALGVCPESPLIFDGRCGENLDCTSGEHVKNGNGVKTGRCVSLNSTHSTCEIFGWCPVENESLVRKIPLNEAENFTLFIKNSVYFKKFQFSRTNVLKTLDDTYFKSCRYDPVTSPDCPVFTIKDIVTKAGHSFEELSLVGGVVRIDIEWRCNLDYQDKTCTSHYSFGLQDISNNFRTATYYWDQKRLEHRDLLKLYGIRFEISVTGEARRFSIVPTAVSLGTGCAFLGSATVLCDLILLYLDTKANFYWECKYEEAKPPKGIPVQHEEESPSTTENT